MKNSGKPSFRVGVVGIGFGQHAHVPAFRGNESCEVEAICASTYQRARDIADRLGIRRAYGNWEELVAAPDIDIVSVATPPTIQPAIVIAALDQGKAVFCEKPLASTRESARAMLAAARQSGLPHMVDFEYVMIDEWQRAKTIIEGGELGEIRYASISWHVETYANRMGIKSWKTDSAIMGGGALNAFVSHVFYYVEWLLGRIHKLSARLVTSDGRGGLHGETGAILCLELTGGVPVAVSVSCGAFLGSGHRLEIYGDNGAIVLENPPSEPEAVFRLLYGNRQTNRLDPIGIVKRPGVLEDGRIAAVRSLVGRFIDWLRKNRPASPSFEEGYRTQCLLDWARQAHAAGSWVEVVS